MSRNRHTDQGYGIENSKCTPHIGGHLIFDVVDKSIREEKVSTMVLEAGYPHYGMHLDSNLTSYKNQLKCIRDLNERPTILKIPGENTETGFLQSSNSPDSKSRDVSFELCEIQMLTEQPTVRRWLQVLRKAASCVCDSG